MEGVGVSTVSFKFYSVTRINSLSKNDNSWYLLSTYQPGICILPYNLLTFCFVLIFFNVLFILEREREREREHEQGRGRVKEGHRL